MNYFAARSFGQRYFMADYFNVAAGSVSSPPPPLAADFSATPLVGYAPLTVTFENKTSGFTTNLSWDFLGDGGSADSTLSNPVYIYINPGSYSPVLTAYNTTYPVINVTVKPNYITVLAPPSAPQGRFTVNVSAGEAPFTAIFQASASGPLSQIYWDFDDDGSYDAFGSAVSYTYTTPGTYRPRMVLIGTGGFDTIVSGVAIAVASTTPIPSTSVVTWKSWRQRL